MNIRLLYQAVILFQFAVSMISTDPAVAFKLRLLHTNDMHARFQQVSQSTGKCLSVDAANNKCYGGFARLKTALNQEIAEAKKENIEVLVLNAGDTYQGTVWYSKMKWKVVLHFVNQLPLDVMTLGNHEFDDQVSGLVPFIEGVKIPVVAANLDCSHEPTLARSPLKKHLILERGGHKIGIIGYVTPETRTMSNPGKLIFLDEIETLTKEAQILNDDGVKIIIGLGHSGLDKDLEIAKKVPHLDIIVGGHSHTFLYTGTQPDSDVPVREYPIKVKQNSGRTVLVTQAYAFTKYLGKFDAFFDDNFEIIDGIGNPILLNSSYSEDPDILKDLTEWEKEFNETLHQVIGKTKVVLDAKKCRYNECNMGNVMADAYIHHIVKSHPGPFWTTTAIALQQGGGVRSTINSTHVQGNITEEDVITTMPFYSTLSVVKLKGQALKKALEWSVTRYNTEFHVGRGEFLQMSGMRVTYDLNKRVGSRVVSVRVRCAACETPEYYDLNVSAEYNVVMPTFLFRGGDNHTALRDGGTEIYQFNKLDTDVVISYLNESSLIYTGLEDRIQFVENRSHRTKFNFFYFIIITAFIVAK